MKTIRKTGQGRARIAFVAVALAAACCGNGGQAPEPVAVAPAPREPSRELRPAPAPEAAPVERAAAPVDWQPLLLFADALEWAHVRSSGLLVDFGTPARHKHTLGDFRSGFRGDFSDGETTFSYLGGTNGHIYFHLFLAEAGKGTIALRAKGIGCTKGRIYLNGAYVGVFAIGTAAFDHAAVEVKEGLRAGPNQLDIQCMSQKTAADGKPAALALDYVRIAPATTMENGPAAASFDALRLADAGGGAGIALGDSEAVTYFVPLPKGGRVSGEARTRTAGAKAVLEVVLAPDDGEETLLAEIDATDKPARFNIDLGAHAGEVAAITLRARGAEVALTGAGLFAPRAPRDKAPGMTKAKSFMLVLVDTLRADKVAAFNPKTRVQTPYLSKLAAESMIFERTLAPENWTKPSVASLLTGLFPSSHLTKDDTDKVPRTVTLAAEHFKRLGYATAGFIANGYVSGKFGFERGFDTYTNYVREGKPNRAQFVVDDVIAWLGRRPPDKPFFLYVHTIDPHVPYIPPRAYWSRYDPDPYNGPVEANQTAKLLERIKAGAVKLSARDKIRLEALYDGEVSYNDDHLARLHARLAELGLLDETLVALTADHGEEFFEHGLVGHGHSLYEELLHVPLIVRLPGAEPGRGARSAEEVSLVDVLPTACAVLGVECPVDVEGRSLVPLLEGRSLDEYPSSTAAEFLAGQRAIRMGRYKLIVRGSQVSLFDLGADPKEATDVAAARPVALTALRGALGMHLRRFSEAASDPAAPRKRHAQEKTTIDPATARQLKALGYLGGE